MLPKLPSESTAGAPWKSDYARSAFQDCFVSMPCRPRPDFDGVTQRPSDWRRGLGENSLNSGILSAKQRLQAANLFADNNGDSLQNRGRSPSVSKTRHHIRHCLMKQFA